MSLKLTIVRHAQSKANSLKVVCSINKDRKIDSLSEKGKDQAILLSEKLNNYQFDTILVSPMNRTYETLKPFLMKINKEPIICDLAIERNLGDFIGKKVSEYKDYVLNHDKKDIPNLKPENGESLQETFERAKLFVDWIKKSFNGQNVLLCSHNGFLKCLDMFLTNKEMKNFYEYPKVENTEIRDYEIK